MDNATRFLNAFYIIEQECRNIINENRYAKFYLVLKDAAKCNSTVRRYEADLQEYADLRNAIVHDRTDEGDVIAQPVDWVVEKIERIAKLLKEPVRVKDHFIKEVKTCSPSDRVKEVYARMSHLETSKMPIYSEGKFQGLLTLKMISDWAVLKQRDNPDPVVSEIFKPQYKTEKVMFAEKNTAVIEVLEYFEEAMRKGITLLAVLITEHGKKEEKALGIITVADLPVLLKLVS